MWGEFGLESKGYAYEPSIRVPFALSYPPLTEQPRVARQLVGNIDIAPTIYDLAGLRNDKQMDGLSLVPLLRGEESNWRSQMLIEGWIVNGGREPFTAIHTGRYKYIENKSSAAELYDVEEDQYELVNLAGNSAFRILRNSLKSEIHQKRRELKTRLRTDLARLRARMSARLKGVKHTRILAARALHKARLKNRSVEPSVKVHLTAVFGADSREARDPFQDYDDY